MGICVWMEYDSRCQLNPLFFSLFPYLYVCFFRPLVGTASVFGTALCAGVMDMDTDTEW